MIYNQLLLWEHLLLLINVKNENIDFTCQRINKITKSWRLGPFIIWQISFDEKNSV